MVMVVVVVVIMVMSFSGGWVHGAGHRLILALQQ